jgi:hypothetical protein
LLLADAGGYTEINSPFWIAATVSNIQVLIHGPYFRKMIINYATKYLLSGLLLLSAMLGTTAAEKPNIIYINIDDLGWADIGINLY